MIKIECAKFVQLLVDRNYRPCFYSEAVRSSYLKGGSVVT